MTRRAKVFSSSIGTKLVIALTGIGLFLYLILHLAGNVLVFFGPRVFNQYSHTLISNPLVVPVEIGLLIIFLIHIFKTVTMWLANQRARPVSYERKAWAGGASRKTVASTTMIVTGVIILLFVVIHVRTFKYGAEYFVADSGIRDLYRLEAENFSSPLAVLFYIVAVMLVGFHLWHGVASAFQSLGADHHRYTPAILWIGKLFAVIIAAGFIIIPLWVHFSGGRP